jgi:hypothetical protein
MEKAYKRFEERQRQRTKFSYGIVGFTIFGVFVQGYLALNAMQYYFVWFLVLVGGMLCAFIYASRQPWGSENLETRIFANLYQASQQLDLCSSQDSKSELCLKKAVKHVDIALYYLTRFEKQLKEINSGLVKTELLEPIGKLRINIGERILTRIEKSEEKIRMLSVLRGLADMFSGVMRPLKLDAINDKNYVLESFDKIDVKEAPKKLSLMLTRKPVRYLLANIISFIVISSVLLIQSFVSQHNFWETLSGTPTFLAFLGLVLALGGGIYKVINKT